MAALYVLVMPGVDGTADAGALVTALARRFGVARAALLLRPAAAALGFQLVWVDFLGDRTSAIDWLGVHPLVVTARPAPATPPDGAIIIPVPRG